MFAFAWRSLLGYASIFPLPVIPSPVTSRLSFGSKYLGATSSVKEGHWAGVYLIASTCGASFAPTVCLATKRLSGAICKGGKKSHPKTSFCNPKRWFRVPTTAAAGAHLSLTTLVVCPGSAVPKTAPKNDSIVIPPSPKTPPFF